MNPFHVLDHIADRISIIIMLLRYLPPRDYQFNLLAVQGAHGQHSTHNPSGEGSIKYHFFIPHSSYLCIWKTMHVPDLSRRRRKRDFEEWTEPG